MEKEQLESGVRKDIHAGGLGDRRGVVRQVVTESVGLGQQAWCRVGGGAGMGDA